MPWADGTSTPRTAAALEASLKTVPASGIPNVVCTVPLFGGTPGSGTGVGRINAVRIFMPCAGTISDFSILNVTPGASTVEGGLYNTASTRVLQWTSTALAVGSAGWQSLGNPNLAVTPGQMFDATVVLNNVSSTIGMITAVSTLIGSLPAGYAGQVTPGAALGSWFLAGTTLPGTVTQGSISGSSLIPYILMKIT